jgi:hypothetical protein
MTSFKKLLVKKMTEKHKTGNNPTTVSWRCKWFIKKNPGVVTGILRHNTADILLRIIENKDLHNSLCRLQ